MYIDCNGHKLANTILTCKHIIMAHAHVYTKSCTVCAYTVHAYTTYYYIYRYGCDIAYTPMIVSSSFIKSNKARDVEFTTNSGTHPGNHECHIICSCLLWHALVHALLHVLPCMCMSYLALQETDLLWCSLLPAMP